VKGKKRFGVAAGLPCGLVCSHSEIVVRGISVYDSHVERQFTLPGQIHVACDTTIIRCVLHNESPWLDEFAKMAEKNHVVFSLADHAIAEVLNQIEDNRFSTEKLRNAICQCARFISRTVPILPGKKQVIEWCKTDPDIKELALDLRYGEAGWNLLLDLRAIEDFKKNILIGKAEEELEGERGRWSNDLRAPPEKWKRTLKHVERLAALADGLENDAKCSPTLVVRLDAALKHYDDLLLKMDGGMNPNSHKRRNDGVDYNMAFVFAKRILLCTDDGNYYDAIKRLNSFQSDWIVKPQELVQRWKEGKLAQPGWP